jgi:hypothetical protein
VRNPLFLGPARAGGESSAFRSIIAHSAHMCADSAQKWVVCAPYVGGFPGGKAKIDANGSRIRSKGFQF